MLNPIVRYTILMLVVAVLGAGWIWQSRVSPAEANVTGRPPAPQIGHPAPDFTLTTLDGNTLTLTELRGRPVVLNFWASWCGPCRAEMPAFERVWQQYGGNVVFVGVDVQESPDRVQAFVDQVGVTYPIPLDSDGAVAQIYRVRAFPSTFFIDADGVIRELSFGSINAPILQSYLDPLLEN